MNRRQKRGTLSLQARGNVLHSTCHFLALGHDRAISNYEAHADWLRWEDVLWNIHTRAQSTKGRTRGGKGRFLLLSLFFSFFLGSGCAWFFLVISCVFSHFLFFLSLHELFTLEFRLARFLFWEFCTPPLKYLMASPQQNSGKWDW